MKPNQAETANEDLPFFLREFGNFQQHLNDQFIGANNDLRGDAFLHFVLRLLPFSDQWKGFGPAFPAVKKSHDKGVDFTAQHEDLQLRLCGQSKYRVRSVEEFNGVFSKFENFEHEFHADGVELTLFPNLDTNKRTQLHYLLVTSVSLTEIRKRYEASNFSSRPFYNRLIDERRLTVIDGPQLMRLLQSLYRKSYVVPTEIKLQLETEYLRSGNVYISVISANTLKELYEEYGSSLFFENIRDFLGIAEVGPNDREAGVNNEIVNTLNEEPDRMLERNNGVTFKAEAVQQIGDRELRLSNCGIVNGCQTTMCVVQATRGASAAQIPIKIVQSELSESWNVAKAANYQNPVSRVDLDLARFLRPQLLHKVATDAGYAVGDTRSGDSISGVLEAIHRTRIAYEGMRLLYLGMFSRKPNNLFDANYTRIRVDVLDKVFEEGKSENVMLVLFRLLKAMEAAAETAQEVYTGEYASLFSRFFKEENYKYRCFLAILAVCASVRKPVGEDKGEIESEYRDMMELLSAMERVLLEHGEYFERVFHLAFENVAMRLLESSGEGLDAEIRQRMASDVQKANFQTLYRQLEMRMDGDLWIREYLAKNSVPILS